MDTLGICVVIVATAAAAIFIAATGIVLGALFCRYGCSDMLSTSGTELLDIAVVSSTEKAQNQGYESV